MTHTARVIITEMANSKLASNVRPKYNQKDDIERAARTHIPMSAAISIRSRGIVTVLTHLAMFIRFFPPFGFGESFQPLFSFSTGCTVFMLGVDSFAQPAYLFISKAQFFV